RRLFREPGGFKGLVPVDVDLEPNQHAIADRELVSVSEFDRYATPRPRGMDCDQDQYALIVDVDKALGLETQLLPRSLLAKSPQLLNPSHHGPVGIRRREIELDLRCHPLGPGGEQRAGGRVAHPDCLDVLLRHRLLPDGPAVTLPCEPSVACGERLRTDSRPSALLRPQDRPASSRSAPHLPASGPPPSHTA